MNEVIIIKNNKTEGFIDKDQIIATRADGFEARGAPSTIALTGKRLVCTNQGKGEERLF